MAIHAKLAKKVLTKAEQKHLTESGINSMAKMKNQIEFMKKHNPKNPSQMCFDCWKIARKLELIKL
jgi:hypothetical protein